MAIWQDIKNALKQMIDEMTIANGFNYDWKYHSNDNIYHPENAVALIFTEEENTDDNNYTGTNQYRNTRQVTIKVKCVNTLSTNDIDLIRELCEEAYEKALLDILKKFNSTYNIAGDTGAIDLQYLGMSYEENEDGDVFMPYVMLISYRVKYIHERGI